MEEGFGGGWAPGGRHGTAPGWVRAEDIAQPWRLSRGALETQPLVLAVVTERTVVATHPVPHDFTHATIRLEVTLQGHGVTSHHGWERLDVDRQVACGEKEKGEVRARGDQEGRGTGLGNGAGAAGRADGPNRRGRCSRCSLRGWRLGLNAALPLSLSRKRPGSRGSLQFRKHCPG